MEKKRGFTVIELLIVIFIIALLTSIIVVIAQNVLKKTRDTRRLADLSQIQKALEIFYSENGQYPCNPNIDRYTTVSTANNCGYNNSWCLLERALNGTDINMDGTNIIGSVIMPNIPRDPAGQALSNTYYYRYDADCGINGDNAQTYGLMLGAFESSINYAKAQRDGGTQYWGYEIGRQPALCAAVSATNQWWLTTYVCNGANP